MSLSKYQLLSGFLLMLSMYLGLLSLSQWFEIRELKYRLQAASAIQRLLSQRRVRSQFPKEYSQQWESPKKKEKRKPQEWEKG